MALLLSVDVLLLFFYSCFTFISFSGLEEVMKFLEQSFPDIEIAIAHGKVFFSL